MSDEKTMKTTPGRNRANLDNANYGDVNLDDYEAKYMPDAGKLTELIELCRGENRPKQDFATLIKVNPPKYSRISQGKVKKQVEKDLLKRIYDHQIEPGRVGLDELLRAGGWRPIRKRREGPVERKEAAAKGDFCRGLLLYAQGREERYASFSPFTMRIAIRSSGSSMSLSLRALLQLSIRSKYTSQYLAVSHQARTVKI